MSECPGCGVVLPARDGPAHPYIGSSPECWALYGDLLARGYSSPEYFAIHQLTFDTYAVQHPGRPDRRSIQSVALHLMTLCLFLEGRADPEDGPRLHKRFATREWFEWLAPPQPNGTITVGDVAAADGVADHRRRVRRWADDVWAAWHVHHPTVRAWVERAFAETEHG